MTKRLNSWDRGLTILPSAKSRREALTVTKRGKTSPEAFQTRRTRLAFDAKNKKDVLARWLLKLTKAMDVDFSRRVKA